MSAGKNKNIPSNKPNQLLLMKHLRQVTSATNIVAEDRDTLLETLYNIYPYFGDPDILVSELVNPPIAKEFVHACPNILSYLEPYLRFYVRDNEGNEEQIYFSDHTDTNLLRELGGKRRGHSVEEVFSPQKQLGANVGIKSFKWQYANRHEGDRIIGATLELYFGSLVELLNKNYLKFIFTNGMKNPHATSLAPKDAKDTPSESQRIKKLTAEIAAAKAKLPGQKVAPASSSTEFKNDFRQLRVACGWSVPHGSQRQLIKMFRGKDAGNKKQKMADFLESLAAMQRVILLNLVDYDVNFQQEGPTTLTIQYVGSTDNYLASETSDIFGSHNSASPMRTKQVLVPVDDINVEDVWREGYLYSILPTKNAGAPPVIESKADGQIMAPVIAQKLLNEMDVLLDMQALLRLKYKGDEGKEFGASMDEIAAWMGPVEAAYEKVRNAFLEERNSEFLKMILRESQVFMVSVKGRSRIKPFELGSSEKLEFQGAVGAADIKSRLDLILKDVTSSDLEKSDVGARRATEKTKLVSRSDQRARFIYYMRLGDILAAAYKNAQIRDDCRFILGTFSPHELGIPGYTQPDDFESLYNIPISMEYFTQFFYNNVVSTGKSTYPYKRFLDDLMSMVSRLLNEVNEYRLRVSFDTSLYSTFTSLEMLASQSTVSSAIDAGIGFLTQDLIKSFPKNIKNRQLVNVQREMLYNYYVVFAKQMNHAKRKGNKKDDEAEGIYHYIIGAECGIAKKFNFQKIEQAHFKALNVESAHYNSSSALQATAAARALFLPQNINIEMVGNTIHKNGDLIYVDSRMVLGKYANEILSLGGYYRVVKSNHSITSAGYETQLECVFEKRTTG